MNDREALDLLQEKAGNRLPGRRSYGRWATVAALLGVSPARVYQWRARDRISLAMRPAVLKLLNRYRCGLPPEWALPPWFGDGGGHVRRETHTHAKSKKAAQANRRRRRPAQGSSEARA